MYGPAPALSHAEILEDRKDLSATLSAFGEFGAATVTATNQSCGHNNNNNNKLQTPATTTAKLIREQNPITKSSRVALLKLQAMEAAQSCFS